MGRIPDSAVAVAAVAATGAACVMNTYRRATAAAHARLAQVQRHTIATSYGTLEYAEHGVGDTVLVSHGIFHGCDGGLASVRDIIGERRVIVPSRFGYLGSAMPPNADGALQADAFVAVLDHLEIPTVDVVGISAGTSAAVQLALRHPDRVQHLIVSSGNWPGSPTAATPPGWAKVFYSDAAKWGLRRMLRPAFGRLMGVPPGFPRNDRDAAVIEELLDSIFPVAPRARGAMFDAYVSNPEINTYPLEAVQVPTLLIHAEDDPLASHEAALAAAARIPDAKLLSLSSGGHLQLGQTELVGCEIASFLGARSAV